MLPQKVEDSLITEILEEAPSASDDTREGVESATGQLEVLRALGDTLKSGNHSPPPPWIDNAAREYMEHTFLDLSRVCFPNIVLPGECKQTDMMASVVQCIGHMCQQRRTQPWLRFGLGLVATKDQLGLLRADAMGLEECIFKKNTGRGIIETVRLALGIMLATEPEQGVHPSVGFREKEIPSVVGSAVTTGSDLPESSRDEPPRKRSRTDAGSSVSIPRPAKYRYKEVNFITLDHQPRTFSRDPPLPAKGRTRYYVKYLLQDHGSLVGRCTRIWCVYREVLGADKSKLTTLHNIPATTPVYIGPYALKFYYADVRSEAYKHDILGVAVEKKVKHVLLPTQAWYTGRVLETLRGLKSGEVPKGLKKTDLKDREEIMMISPFKRTLAQFATAGEFYGALIGALKGIQSLEKAGIIHGDISMGNIVLNSEDYPASQPAVNYINVDGTLAAFVRRDFVDLGADGGLHDLDMAAFIPANVPIEPREPISKLREAVARPRSMPPPPAPLLPPNPERSSNLAFRTGTTPFMSIPVLTGGHNSVYDDMQSLFFVHYLSLFSFDTPAPNCYPEAPTTRIPPWPAKCNEWAVGQGMKMSHLGGSKKVFFQHERNPWSMTAKLKCLEFWKDKNTGRLDAGHYLVLKVFWDELWEYVGDDDARVRRWTATPSNVLENLENAVEYVMKTGDLDDHASRASLSSHRLNGDV
ncbi:hypothetical protein Hypma_011048 [Hypsizygus marmoreus]|uniref:Fungal-type protein kinase domain-containing protein n=1 Tax=Hypsizygus marmoreus TaxID=39966 RepID=A0A369JQL3_HYPMA|nr:hypothetical protein Hypma_011048 [Hypsizygus marmoreus]